MRHRLSPTSYLVLGMIGWLERATPYQLKRLAARSIGDLWAFPHSQLYAEPQRLVGLGLLAEEREPAGRRRRFYRLTDAGREELESWLEDPEAPPREVHDAGVLKLLFADQLSPAAVARLARAQVEAYEQSLVRYRADAEDLADADDGRYHSAALRWGAAYSECMLTFWNRVAESVERSGSARW
jgi:PadR family transcriptional regulator, regulatory protein AphA